jgi:hypothetical protein
LKVANDAAGEAINDLGQMMDRNGLAPDYMKKFYDCPECGEPQWVWKGVPFEGVCVECNSKKGLIGQVGAGIGGVFNGVIGFFK